MNTKKEYLDEKKEASILDLVHVALYIAIYA